MVKDSRAWRAVQGILKSDTTLQLNNINKEREEQSIPRARVVNAATRGEERETAVLLSRVMFTLANAVFVYCFLTCIFTHLLWLHWQLADLIPWVGIEPMASAVEALSSNHWSAREVPWYLLKHQYIFFFHFKSHCLGHMCHICFDFLVYFGTPGGLCRCWNEKQGPQNLGIFLWLQVELLMVCMLWESFCEFIQQMLNTHWVENFCGLGQKGVTVMDK